jgi:hypothetical protein
MDVNIHINAVRRYAAMAGHLKDASQAEHERALSDREDLGEEYLPERACGLDKAALLLRFMHEVCRIPLWQARQCAISIIGSQEAFRMDGRRFEDVATELAQETGNILIAEAAASLYLAAAEGSAWELFWQQVLETLRCGDVVEDDEQAEPGRPAEATLH